MLNVLNDLSVGKSSVYTFRWKGSLYKLWQQEYLYSNSYN